MAKKQTYASKAKQIMNRYKLRLGDKFDKGDPLALEAMNAELSTLQEQQESVRISELPVEQRTFAKGGTLPTFQGPGPFSQYLNQGNQMPFNGGVFDTLPSTPAGAISAQTGSQSTTDVGDPFKSRVPYFGAVAQGLTSILGNRKLDMPEFNVDEFTPEKITANQVNFSRGREGIARERDIANQTIRRSARGRGSRAGLTENILAGATATQRTAGSQIEESIEREGNINAQIRNQTAQFNAQQGSQAQALNLRNQLFGSQVERENFLINAQRKDAQIGGVGSAITGYGKDLLSAGQYDQMVNMMGANNPNFQIGQGPDSPFKRLFQISKDAKINFRNTGDFAS